MGNVSREMGILRNNQKEMLEIKTNKKQNKQNKKKTPTEVKKGFDGLINRLGTAEQRISELEHISIESLKIKK